MKKSRQKPIAKETNQYSMNANQVLGLLTAVLSAPSLIMPSAYYPIVFGGNPSFKSEQQYLLIFNLLAVLTCTIKTELNNKKDIFNLTLLENDEIIPYQKACLNYITHWQQGYLLGVKMDSLWFRNNKAISSIMPLHFPEQRHFFLPIIIKEIYSFWEKQRKHSEIIYGKNEMLIWLKPKFCRIVAAHATATKNLSTVVKLNKDN